MSKFQAATPDRLQQLRLDASAHFAPMMLHEALLRLSHACGGESLDRFEKAMVDQIEAAKDDRADFDTMKEFAIEQLYALIREANDSPKKKQSLEKIETRRTSGRSEEPQTLEDQLQSGLEDSFPASDPPAVLSTTISGGTKKLVGTDEILKKRRQPATGESSQS
ncbi:hypothetical protein MESS2_1640040 [Mesorhizobium metallidurans STM 2683]|uniref:Uncharacterized protein n=1 Tax=Mesorhizobium metallidurans STM 2683 TaxID=1297569 RepID=M5EN02_9HYPH|nr:hypothetical protein [Mesorhizobium metallidurans]CCV05712.1 hypothetical protein MESS2_1640040 [Mesorhizobium metallidurans STM 2683]